jgi:hypothetical protein
MGCAGSTESNDEGNGAAACQRLFRVSGQIVVVYGKDQHGFEERHSLVSGL